MPQGSIFFIATFLLVFTQLSCVAGGGGTNHIPIKSAVYGNVTEFIASSAPDGFFKQALIHYECGHSGHKFVLPMNMDGVEYNGNKWSLNHRFTVDNLEKIDSTYKIRYKIVFIRSRPFEGGSEVVRGVYSIDILPDNL